MDFRSDFDQWDKLRIFYYVTKFKSINRAAEYLNISQPAITRSIQILEFRLKVKVLSRHPKGVTLTQEGEILFKIVDKFFSEIHGIKNLLQENEKELKGYLKIIATTGFVSLYLMPHLAKFLKMYPELRVDVQGTDTSPDLELYEADLIVHPYIKNRPDLIQELLLKVQYKLYASPLYLEKHGTPQKPEDLDHHMLIGFGSHSNPLSNINWHLTIGSESNQPREPYVQVNMAQGRFVLAEAGLGIMTAPQDHTGLKGRNLVEVLPHVVGPTLEMYCIYSEKLKGAKRIQVFVDYLKKIFSDHF
jgi:DNA-binding transcriptional LysR family regulator